MLRKIRNWFARRRALTTFRQVVQAPEEWTGDDALALRDFLECHTGRKVVQRLQHRIVVLSLSVDHSDAFQDGIRAGLSLCIGNLVSLASSRGKKHQPRAERSRPLAMSDGDKFS